MSLIKEVVFGSITIDLLKQTNIWKEHQNEEGRVPSHVLRVILETLGFDLTKTIKKEKPFSSFKAPVRDKMNPSKAYWTIVFSGKIKPSCPWIEAFKKNDVVSELNLDKLGIKNFEVTSGIDAEGKEFGVDAVAWRKIQGSKDNSLAMRYM